MSISVNSVFAWLPARKPEIAANKKHISLLLGCKKKTGEPSSHALAAGTNTTRTVVNNRYVYSHTVHVQQLQNDIKSLNNLIRLSQLNKFDIVYDVVHLNVLSNNEIYCLVANPQDSNLKKIVLHCKKKNGIIGTQKHKMKKVAVSGNSFVRLGDNIEWHLYWKFM